MGDLVSVEDSEDPLHMIGPLGKDLAGLVEGGCLRDLGTWERGEDL